MSDERTSDVKPVSTGLATLGDRMIEDALRKYPGGLAKLELFKGDPDFIPELYAHIDRRAAIREASLPFEQRQPWKILPLGTHKSPADFAAALEKNENKLSTWGRDVLNKTPLATTLSKIKIWKVQLSELGLKHNCTTTQIWEAAARCGFVKLSAEVGPQLRDEYTDQPKGEWIRVGMEPITASGGRPSVFFVARDDGGRYLYARYAGPDDRWDAGSVWVFGRK